jgi:hypothetical protein
VPMHRMALLEKLTGDDYDTIEVNCMSCVACDPRVPVHILAGSRAPRARWALSFWNLHSHRPLLPILTLR